MASLGARPSLSHLREPAVFIKVPEIVLLLIAIITYSADNPGGDPAYVASVLAPCLLNSLVFLTNYLLGYSQLRHTPVELALYIYYVITVFISAIVLLTKPSSSLIASGVFCIFLSLLYGVEVFLSYTGLVNRVPLPAENQGPDPTLGTAPNLPTVAGAPPAYSSTPSTLQTGFSNVDLGRGPTTYPAPWPAPTSTINTNPVYPEAMNYPPNPFDTTTTTTTTPPPTKQEEPHP